MRAACACVVLLGGLAAVAAPVPKEPPLPEVTKEHLKASKQNLKQIGIAFHGFHDKNLVLPTDIVDNDGKPVLSWRVAILPYIEEEELYKQFKLNESWDSDHNKKLIEKMPKVFAPIRVKPKAGETFYQVFYGETALFGPGKLVLRIPASMPDGTSITALAVEAGESVVWTQPADIPFDEKKPLPKLGGLFDGEFHVALCDGSVMLVKKDFDADEMKKLITPADGEILDTDKLKK